MTLDRNDDIRLAEEDARQADLDVEARGADDVDGAEVEVAEIRTEIEETRLEMGGTLDELGDRLDPGNLMNEAKENVREATIGRVEETAKGMSDMVMDTIKRNPIPAAMAGAGVALLWMNRSSGSAGSDVGRTGYVQRDGGWSEGGIGHRVGGAASTVGDNVGEVAGQVGQTAQQLTGEVVERGQQAVDEVGWRIQRFMDASPLAVGAIAIGAGALVGSLVPETEQEQEMLGDASRQVGTAVRDTVNEAGRHAERAVDEAERSMSSVGATE